ncbi:MAG TPA: hypothetical protein PKI51_01820 [Anaerolineaceae bacterium]|nr:hypothetical protein [Anaerolineaceae bacterium]HNZ14725.1 hypothetical protein [Anaerolineaceae bacterium]
MKPKPTEIYPEWDPLDKPNFSSAFGGLFKSNSQKLYNKNWLCFKHSQFFTDSEVQLNQKKR